MPAHLRVSFISGLLISAAWVQSALAQSQKPVSLSGQPVAALASAADDADQRARTKAAEEAIIIGQMNVDCTRSAQAAARSDRPDLRYQTLLKCQTAGGAK